MGSVTFPCMIYISGLNLSDYYKRLILLIYMEVMLIGVSKFVNYVIRYKLRKLRDSTFPVQCDVPKFWIDRQTMCCVKSHKRAPVLSNQLSARTPSQ
jgi:hypothetical protein